MFFKLGVFCALPVCPLDHPLGCQVTFDEKHKDAASELRKEFVIKVEGEVVKKPEPNKNLKTGDVEVIVDKFEILNKAEPLPIPCAHSPL